jgi:hypothetical protein
MRTRNAFPFSCSTPPYTHYFLSVPPIVLAPTELVVVDFDCNVGTADFLREAQHIGQTWPLSGIGPSL